MKDLQEQDSYKSKYFPYKWMWIVERLVCEFFQAHKWSCRSAKYFAEENHHASTNQTENIYGFYALCSSAQRGTYSYV